MKATLFQFHVAFNFPLSFTLSHFDMEKLSQEKRADLHERIIHPGDCSLGVTAIKYIWCFLSRAYFRQMNCFTRISII